MDIIVLEIAIGALWAAICAIFCTWEWNKARDSWDRARDSWDRSRAFHEGKS